jgi:glycosyltransferase involved in cell wall biosynthesis
MCVDAVGGVWRYAMDLGAALHARGIEVVFACFGPPASVRQIAEAEAVGRFVAVEAPLDWTAAGEDKLSEVPHHIARLVDEHGIDLLHLNLPSQAAGLDLSVPVVVVSHSCVVTWFRAVRGTAVSPDWAWQERLNRDGFTAADLALAPSRSHAALLSACYGPLPHLQVVYNASRPAPAAATEREPFIIAAGRWWDEGKNGKTLDQAAENARWPVMMAGSLSGPNGQYLPLRYAKPLREIGNADLRSLMARAGAFVSPSIYEPFGLAALEAALAGTPLLLADIPTYRELWGDAALFVPSTDPGAFRQGIDRLASDKALRGELGKKARERASRYTQKAQTDAVLDAYAEAMQHSRPALRKAG